MPRSKAGRRGGITALYITIRDAQQKLIAGTSSDQNRAVVVLTDGSNKFPYNPYSKEQLLTALRAANGANAAHPVRVYTIGYGPEADEGLGEISNATGGKFYKSPDRSNIDDLMRNIVNDVGIDAT